MTTAEVAQMLRSVGIPTVYHHFAENTGQEPPFICFYYPNDDDFKADNTNYRAINELIVELYTDTTDFTLQAQLEAVLTGAGLVYSKTEEYLDTERMYMETYTTEVLIDG